MTVELLNSNKSFGGWHKQYRHCSESLNCEMNLSIYLPPQVSEGHSVPVLYWLSGLTCTDENFMQKAGAQRIAAELGIAIVAPDTSPRGNNIPDDEAYDLGQGAGFYLNATEPPWNRHYKMYDYVVNELPSLIQKHFPVSDKQSIAGHSMGGHGALVLALNNPEKYQSVSAFSPICNPIDSPWGKKAFTAYLGTETQAWRNYDACALISDSKERLPILVDQGDSDQFLVEQLKPDVLASTAKQSEYPITIRHHDGYDHSYYFIASLIEDHLRFHSAVLNK